MLEATFQCFQGIGAEGEQRLWERGCLCWQDFRNGAGESFSTQKQKLVHGQLNEAESALNSGAADWFLNRLKGVAALRVLREFYTDTLFLDIETTGLDHFAEVTSIATWRNGQAKCFVRDINLSDFLYELPGTRLLVTYNGKRFDLPFLRREFDIELTKPHLDLMYPLRAMGFRGGLKACERLLGFQRRYSEGTDGMEAVYLWYDWSELGHEDALKRLVVYNVEDTYSLAWLAASVIGKSMAGYPIADSAEIDSPSPPSMVEVLTPLAL